ncbi:MAG: hypothetical protein AAGI53_07110 [Planctomycetota bacterium]
MPSEFDRPPHHVSEVKRAFIDHGYPMEPGIAHLLDSGLLGKGTESPLNPYCAAVVECMPLSVRFPDAGVDREVIVFARSVASDDLACVERETRRVFEVHYDLSNPAWLDWVAEYDDSWVWLESVVRSLKTFHKA